MKNKIIYSLLLGVLVFPTTALAQWTSGMSAAADSELPTGTVKNIITKIMMWALGLVGIIGIIGFIISGVLYLTAAGDEKKMGTAKNAMTYSIIGVVVALMGYVVIQAVDAMLGGSSVIY